MIIKNGRGGSWSQETNILLFLNQVRYGISSWNLLNHLNFFRNSVEQYHSKLAWVDHDRKWTYEQYFEQLNSSAKGLIELGLEPHKTVAILGNNSPEWFSSAVGAVFAGELSSQSFCFSNT